MRILYSHRVQSKDGQSVHIEELVGALRALGHEVLVVGPALYQKSEFGGESRMLSVLRALLPGAALELAELAYNVKMYLHLRGAFRRFAPDMLYERYNLYYLAGACLARRYGLPYYVEVNSPLAEERSSFGGLHLKRLARWTERFVWRSATRVLTVTRALRDIVVQSGVAAERVAVIANGVALDRFAARRESAAGAVELAFVGFVRSWHGIAAILDGMASQPLARPLRLTVIGDGPVRAELERQAARLGLSGSVRFTGVVAHHDVPGLLAGFDIGLQPKAVPYASPLKIFDYMAAGLAIVAPDQPNIREILQHDATALLFDPDRPGAMWQAIQRLVEQPETVARLGRAARAELERQDYTWLGNARRVVALQPVRPAAPLA